MATDFDKAQVTLGAGDLYLNNIHVGYLKGDVEFTFKQEKKGFKPTNSLANVKTFVISEEAALKASLAQLDMAKVKLAMGASVAVGASQSFPVYDPSSYSVPASASYDVQTFGGDKTVQEMSMRFEHTKENGMKIIIILYSAVSSKDLTIAFKEEDVNLYDIMFEALAVEGRPAGDQLGVMVEQVLAAA